MSSSAEEPKPVLSEKSGSSDLSSSNVGSSPHPADAGARPQPRSGVVGRLHDFYDKAMTQVALVGLICFMCPGMFNALGGIGGGGQVNSDASSRANTALYACFAGLSFFSGSIHNMIGTRRCLCVGALGYSLYIASFLAYNHIESTAFVVAAGAILGLCAAIFWTAQGAIMLAYPVEQDKSTAWAIVWVIFNLGAVIGSAIELGLTYNSTAPALGDAVYCVFLVLTFIGACLSCILKAPSTVKRSDGTQILIPLQLGWRQEFYNLYKLLITDPWIILLFPLFLSSNFPYVQQQNMYNGVLFTLRGRALNSLVYWLAQMIAAYLFSFVLDSKLLVRRKRMWLAWGITTIFVWAVNGAFYQQQTLYTRESVLPTNPNRKPLIDLNQREFVGPSFLYFFGGAQDALIQGFAYALMGAFSNKMSTLAALAGFYKSIQSAGGAAGFGLDTAKKSYHDTFVATWVVCAAALVIAMPVLHYRVTNHTIDEEVALIEEQEARATGTLDDGDLKHASEKA